MDARKRKEILETVAKLRVTDIRDGMDWVGLHHVGTVDPEIRPLYRTKAAGFAQTYRHIPTQQRVPELTPEDYTKWAYEYWYRQLWDMGDFREQVGEGDFLVIDTMGQKTPAVGSMDSMVWAARGAKGVLTNGGARDTDEQLYQKAMPCWHRWVVQPMYQGRVEFGEPNSIVEIGGATVRGRSGGRRWGRRHRRAAGRDRRRDLLRQAGVRERPLRSGHAVRSAGHCAR
jgi:4-hydroxy-4-methyl-2-oxoglutarate aldolase